MSEDRKVAVVAGATSGMGWEVSHDLARDHHVFALGRSADALEALARHPSITAVPLDITSESARAEFAATLDRVDVVVHAASLAEASEPLTPVESWNRMLGMFLVAPAELTRLVLPLVRSVRGTVVFIGSGASTRAVPGMAQYTAAKHALRGYADVLRIDEADAGVRVATVAPGPTDTAGLRCSHSSSGAPYEPDRYIQPLSVARAVRFVVDATDDVHITDVAVRPRRELAR